MRGKLVIDEFGPLLLALGLEENLNPADVVLCGVGMGDLLPHGNLELKPLAALYRLRTFNHWHVLFRLPVGSLKEYP